MSETLTEAATTEAPDDIRSALTAAMEQQDAPVDKATTSSVAARDAETGAVDGDGATDRARGPDGKFIKADEAAPVEPQAKPESAPAEPTTETKPEPVKATEPPANWAATDKATFAKMPADAQEFLLRRHTAMEADYTRKTQEIAAFRRDYEPVAQLLGPHADAIRSRGLTPASLIQAWANVEQSLTQGHGIQVVKNLVSGYNIDKAKLAEELGLRPVASHAAATPEQPNPDQNQAQLPPEIVQRLTAHEQWIQRQDQETRNRANWEYQQAVGRVENEITQFASSTDKDGALLHPHFEAVRDDMTRLAAVARASGTEPKLSDLYDQAVWANPSVRTQLLEQQRAADEVQRTAAEKQRQAEARAKAEAARKASKSVTGAPSTGQPPKDGPMSLREQLQAAAEEREAA